MWRKGRAALRRWPARRSNLVSITLNKQLQDLGGKNYVLSRKHLEGGIYNRKCCVDWGIFLKIACDLAWTSSAFYYSTDPKTENFEVKASDEKF